MKKLIFLSSDKSFKNGDIIIKKMENFAKRTEKIFIWKGNDKTKSTHCQVVKGGAGYIVQSYGGQEEICRFTTDNIEWSKFVPGDSSQYYISSGPDTFEPFTQQKFTNLLDVFDGFNALASTLGFVGQFNVI